MKITGSGPLGSVAGIGAGDGRPPTSTTSLPSPTQVDPVRLSTSAQFLQELRSEVEAIPTIRSDAVSQARADIQNGTLGHGDDLDRTVDALLAGEL